MSNDVDLDRVRALLAQEAVRFCDHRSLDDVARLLRARLAPGGIDDDGRAHLRRLVVQGGERGLFAAIALATVDDGTGLALLRAPHDHFMTNSCVEVGLAQCARLALGDLQAPLSFINAPMLGSLAVAVGAFKGPALR